ncbi:MAG: 2-C-methyl-D-erythritol 2,4-cyclodiphosphate synthase [Planctomycetaceae bacterium]|nr:2-C-methyl-D-erythritol 2,4-cyclodiphosphate synthase [Planctomycetaceae bacterium]
MFRVGLGHDTHRTTAGKPLLLGGVEIPSDFGLDGHSDADALLHAVTDALLGAAGLGDIGEWFPDTSAEFAGANSADLLRTVVTEVTVRGWRVVNLDCILFAERPKLSAFKPQIAARMAELLGVDPSVVNVKAKTGERVGPVGRGEAVQAEVVVLLEMTP